MNRPGPLLLVCVLWPFTSVMPFFILRLTPTWLFLSHLMSLLSCLCRSKEQRKNHREQLLPTLVKQKTPPPQPNKQTYYTHVNIHTLCSLLLAILPAVDLTWFRKSGWGCYLLWLNSCPIWGFYCANIFTFCPQTFTLSAELAVVSLCFMVMTLNITFAPLWTCSLLVSFTEPSNIPGTRRYSWTWKRYKGCVDPSLLATWMFPQVLLNGVNPLTALNQFVNSEVFIVSPSLRSWLFLFTGGVDLHSPCVENMSWSSQTVPASYELNRSVCFCTSGVSAISCILFVRG